MKKQTVVKVKKPTLKEKYAQLKTVAQEYDKSVRFPEVTRPYHYATKVKIDGKDAMSMINTLELYAHVQTANRLGHYVVLETNGDKLQVVFVKRFGDAPKEFYE